MVFKIFLNVNLCMVENDCIDKLYEVIFKIL